MIARLATLERNHRKHRSGTTSPLRAVAGAANLRSLMLKSLLRRLRADESRDRDASITTWARGVEGCSLIRDVEERAVVRFAGLVSRIKVRPRDGVAAFEATVQDGTGEVRAVWLGRRSVPGLNLGARLILEGRLGRDAKGRLQLVNPVYEFEAAPGAH